MFAFSQGFETAVLKIPSKDNTISYGRSDPFNLVQGAVAYSERVGDWPPASDEQTASQFGSNGSAPPRKQIIGFAKFHTRQDALAAKDHLQGKRIDMEKGTVLKAEMAKKNLHTRRGVSSRSSSTSAGSQVGLFVCYIVLHRLIADRHLEGGDGKERPTNEKICVFSILFYQYRKSGRPFCLLFCFVSIDCIPAQDPITKGGFFAGAAHFQMTQCELNEVHGHQVCSLYLPKMSTLLLTADPSLSINATMILP